MARERNGFITARPEDFVSVTGAPYYPARLMGEEGDHLVPTNHWYLVIDGQPWMRFGFVIGPIRRMCEERDNLNSGIGVDEELRGARFAVGPTYYWNSSVREMTRMSDRTIAYAVWINRLSDFKSQEVVQVQEVTF